MWLSEEAPWDYWRGSLAADRGEVQAEKSPADLRAAAEAMAAVDGCAQKRRLDRASIDVLMEAWQVAPQESRALVGKLTASLQNPSAYLMTAAQRILADCYWGDAPGELRDAERQEYREEDRIRGENNLRKLRAGPPRRGMPCQGTWAATAPRTVMTTSPLCSSFPIQVRRIP